MSLFDIEHLQKLTFERSKNWASLLESISKTHTLDDFDLNEVDNFYASECVEDDTNDELASMEDDTYNELSCLEDDVTIFDSEVFRNVTNTARFSSFLNNKTLVQPDSSRFEQNKLIDIFNHTLPIIKKHNRQLEEFGLDKILISFDKNKIEEEVGGWLNRHNSLYGGDNTLLIDVAKSKDHQMDRQSTKNATIVGKYNRNMKEAVNDSDDSLQSGETARYIRSSRIGAIKKSTSTTTMIKTYRTVKSTREALYKKYSCKMDDDEHHLKAIRHNRTVSHRQHQYDLTQCHKSRKYDATPLSSLTQRRKVYRKRICSNSCSTMHSSSEDSDNCHEDYGSSQRKPLNPCYSNLRSAAKCKNYSHQIAKNSAMKTMKTRSGTKMPSARMNRIYYYSRSQSFSVSSSSCSFSSVREMRRKTKRNANVCNDNRLRKRESECQCCNAAKLCDEFKHTADTSTEEWYVENNCSPKKLPEIEQPLTSVTEKMSLTTKNKSKTNLKDEFPNENAVDRCIEEIYVENYGPPRKLLKTPKSATSATKELPSMCGIVPVDVKSKKISKANTIKRQSTKETLSKKKSKTNKIKTYLEDESLKEKEISDCELKMAIKTSQKSYEKEQLRLNKEMKKKGNNDTLKMEVEVSKLNEATQKNLENNTREETFFTASKTICNSTALSSESNAYNRQIVDQLVHKVDQAEISQNVTETDLTKSDRKQTKTQNSKIKKSNKKKVTSFTTSEDKKEIQKLSDASTVSSTTEHSPEISFKLTSEQFRNNETDQDNGKNCGDHCHCAFVTSTTNIELPVARTTNEKIENMQQHNSTKNSNKQNGILIYTPDNRNMAPENSFTPDGYFTITKEHLSRVICEKPAEKFLKYYVGPKRFRSDSIVYYIPPTATKLLDNNESKSSDSADELDNFGQYGDLYAIRK